MRHIGVTDNGDVVDVVSPDTDADARVVERWPPFGLRLRTVPSAGGVAERVDRQPALRVEIERWIEVNNSDLSTVDPADRVTVRVDDGTGLTVRAGGWDAVESELGLFTVERLAGLVAVHAGVLVTGGRAVLVPGVSHSGKSTLCAAAVDAGVEVWSDEFALVDAEGMVRGWPRPLRVRTADGVKRVPLPPPTTEAPVPVGAVVCTRFDAGADRTVLEPCDRLDAMTHVLMNTVCARSRAEEAFGAASIVTRDAVLLSGVRADADEALSVMLRAIGTGR